MSLFGSRNLTDMIVYDDMLVGKFNKARVIVKKRGGDTQQRHLIWQSQRAIKLQVKESQIFPARHQKLGRAAKDLPWLSEDTWAGWHLNLKVLSCDTAGNNGLLVFSPTQFAVHCSKTPRKWVQMSTPGWQKSYSYLIHNLKQPWQSAPVSNYELLETNAKKYSHRTEM